MPQVKGIQHREPYSHSALGYSNYDRFVDCAEFVVEKQTYGKEVTVNIFFHRSTAPQQGVGLLLPSHSGCHCGGPSIADSRRGLYE